MGVVDMQAMQAAGGLVSMGVGVNGQLVPVRGLPPGSAAFLSLPAAAAGAAGGLHFGLPPAGFGVNFGGLGAPLFMMGQVAAGPAAPPPAPLGVQLNGAWRVGDWVCTCGFHNYASRVTCKRCSKQKGDVAPLQQPNGSPSPHGEPPFSAAVMASMRPSLAAPLSSPSVAVAPGMKRVPSDLGDGGWSMKRQISSHDLLTIPQHQLEQQLLAACGVAPAAVGNGILPAPMTAAAAGGASGPSFVAGPPGINLMALAGKGASHWRTGDWLCTACNNHNFASRQVCNRCSQEKLGGAVGGPSLGPMPEAGPTNGSLVS
eukprot:SM000056S18019  [mRNA]  locus=s56:613979:615481:- [translate_table: standard]